MIPKNKKMAMSAVATDTSFCCYANVSLISGTAIATDMTIMVQSYFIYRYFWV